MMPNTQVSMHGSSESCRYMGKIDTNINTNINTMTLIEKLS